MSAPDLSITRSASAVVFKSGSPAVMKGIKAHWERVWRDLKQAETEVIRFWILDFGFWILD
jgi:hypothetical protein